MKAFFSKLEWQKGSRGLVQGIRNGRVPYNAVCGGNGSFICDTPAAIILTLKTEDGREVRHNIISVIRAVNSWARITETRFQMIKEKLERINEFEFDEQDFIINLGEYVYV